jgi:hypothetical protein
VQLLIRRLPFCALLVLQLLAGRCWAESGAPISCRTAASAAEARFGLPAGLLLAIGRVESGRLDPATGAVEPWPWSININGTGRVFDTQADAITKTRTLRDDGMNSIDVGCFQINLFHHPNAFASLDEAFDPSANATYAANFLTTLRQRLGTWEEAVAAYHSSVPERGIPYRDRVLGRLGAPKLPAASPVPKMNMVSWTPNPSRSAIRVWTPSAPGQAAYVISIGPARASAGDGANAVNRPLR